VQLGCQVTTTSPSTASRGVLPESCADTLWLNTCCLGGVKESGGLGGGGVKRHALCTSGFNRVEAVLQITTILAHVISTWGHKTPADLSVLTSLLRLGCTSAAHWPLCAINLTYNYVLIPQPRLVTPPPPPGGPPLSRGTRPPHPRGPLPALIHINIQHTPADLLLVVDDVLQQHLEQLPALSEGRVAPHLQHTAQHSTAHPNDIILLRGMGGSLGDGPGLPVAASLS
jgi:hypothetical protein